MTLGQADFDYLSDHVVSRYVNDKTPLNDAILKVAQDQDMNPDQIRRLVEASNTKTFLSMFKTAENKGKNIEFPVADAKEVIGSYYNDSGSEKTASVQEVSAPADDTIDSWDMPDMMKVARHGAVPDFPDELKIDDSYTARPDRHAVIHRLRKIASNFTEKLYEKEHEYQDGLEKICMELKKDYGPSLGEFEKNAHLTHGEDIHPLLEDVRSMLYKGKLDVASLPPITSEKIAYVLEETSELKILGEMYKHKTDQIKYARAVKLTNSKIKVACA